MQLVDFGLASDVPRLFHFDGEFARAEDLIENTLAGRPMGWLLGEREVAIAQVAKVIREDSGINPRQVRDKAGYGVAYSRVLRGDPALPRRLQLPVEYRLEVRDATDQEVFGLVARLIHAYMDSLRFGRRDTARQVESPYDLFLAKNGLPGNRLPGEDSSAYSLRLLNALRLGRSFVWVHDRKDRQFDLHEQTYSFGPEELTGLFTFLSGPRSFSRGGNCSACHPPPRFTDDRFHNTGVSQTEYDSIFGDGSFLRLDIPDLDTRRKNHDQFLPATHQHPNALERFRTVPTRGLPTFADLGVWNIYANPDFPLSQPAFTQWLCEEEHSLVDYCSQHDLLPKTIGRFKTPSLRDLGHSDPYFHSGMAGQIEDAVLYYLRASSLARTGRIRNGAPELLDITLNEHDVRPLVSFLRSLNEDYQ
jgi:cytochrome c peroxidase